MLAVNVESVLGHWRSATFFSGCVIFFGLVLSLKLQIELSGIHRSQEVPLTELQGIRKSDFYSETSLSVECLCCYIIVHKVTGQFHTKTQIRFILIRMYKNIATFIGYLD